MARPRRKRADCQVYEQPDKADDGLLCIGDRFKLDSEVSYCAEPYSPGSWYLAAKKGIDLGMDRRLGADPATFRLSPDERLLAAGRRRASTPPSPPTLFSPLIRCFIVFRRGWC